MKSLILKLIFFFAFLTNGYAQELLPFVENYSKYNYQGDNQIWNVVQGNDKALYFANNHYFLRYNGVKWEKYALPNKTIIRSVFVQNEKIYSGSYKEFGYWFRKNGKMFYVSISKNKKLFSDNGNEEIWKIFSFQDKIYFQSFNEIFVLDNSKIERLELPFQISYCFAVNSQLLFASIKQGVFKYVNNKFEKIENWKILDNNVIHAIEFYDNKTYIFTQKNGVFVSDKNGIKPWDNPLNIDLKSSLINIAKFTNSNKLIIGTASKGVFIIDLVKKSSININRNNSLMNNSILSIGLDNENDLWLGLDNGIAHVEIASPIEIFSDNSGNLGSVYSVVTTDDGYLLASNHGIFEYSGDKLAMFPSSQGQAWNISKVKNNYIIGQNEGSFLFENKSLKKINPVNGGWNFTKSMINNSFLQATYSGIVIYNNPENFGDYNQIKDFYKPIKYVAQNRINEIWAADNYRGLYRVIYDEKFKATVIENVALQNKITNDFGVKIFEFRDEILFYLNNIWFFYNHITGLLEKNIIFNQNFKDISDIVNIDNNNFLVLKAGILYLINAKQNNFFWNIIQEKYYRGKIINDNLKIFKDQNKYLLNLDDGFISLRLKNQKPKVPKIVLEAYSNELFIKNGDKIKYNSELELHVISGLYGYSKSSLFYEIDGNKKFIEIKEAMIINNLNSGAHKIKIYYHDGSKLNEISIFRFDVGKPWYFSVWMILLYLLGIGLILFFYYKWNKIKYNQKLELYEEEMKHQKKILEIELKAENELHIQEYEKHILELEVQTKSSEVAGKSLSIAKQSEMIDNIQFVLDNENDINKLKSEIKKSIKINAVNKHEWQTFESNMNQINNEFVINLSKKYPNLTSKDIKLCVFLKMNLSSKEIAPLLNISFRGVELHRYRLRKKLQITANENLNKFMLSI